MKRKEINEVFTPRRPTVNNEMYIERPSLEKNLHRSIVGSMHTFLFGESGNGKSWLYKNLLAEKGMYNIIVNCANASRKESIVAEIFSVSVGKEFATRTGATRVSKMGGSIGIKYEETKSDIYEISTEDNLLIAFEEINKKSKSKQKIIVFDNVETLIDNNKLLNELSDMIILLDDERYAKFNIKFLLVGLPNSVLKYFTTSKNSSSVSNRIEEVPKVSGLDLSQINTFVEKGFCDFLKIDISSTNIEKIAKHILSVTLGVPQRIHEYCECLGYILEDNNYLYTENFLTQADQAWLLKGLRESYSLIESYLNSEETLNGRRNQVLYCIGKSSGHEISTNRIGEILNSEFSNNQPSSNSGIGNVLSHLAKGDNPLIKVISKTNNNYTLSDPRHLMCIRVILKKDFYSEKVSKRTFTLN